MFGIHIKCIIRNENSLEFKNHLVHSWNCTAANIGVFKCIGQPIIVQGAGRFKHGCGSEACTGQDELAAKCVTHIGH